MKNELDKHLIKYNLIIMKKVYFSYGNYQKYFFPTLGFTEK